MVFSKFELPATLQIVSDICLVDPDDQVMICALIAKLITSEKKCLIYFRTSPQDKMDPTTYWIIIIEFIKNFKSVKIPYQINIDGCLIFGKSLIKFIDGNDNCFVDAKYFVTEPIEEEIKVETTLLCGPESESKIITTNKNNLCR